MNNSAVIVALILLAPGALGEPTVETAKPAASAEAAKPQVKTEDDMKVVCKILAPETGTRLGGRRVCLTQFDWNAQRSLPRDALNHMSQSNRGGK